MTHQIDGYRVQIRTERTTRTVVHGDGKPTEERPLGEPDVFRSNVWIDARRFGAPCGDCEDCREDSPETCEDPIMADEAPIMADITLAVREHCRTIDPPCETARDTTFVHVESFSPEVLDVEIHGTYTSAPAINVKVPWFLEEVTPECWDLARSECCEDEGKYGDTEFGLAWVRETLSDETLSQVFADTCGFEFEYGQSRAKDLLGDDGRAVCEGRSGGWMVFPSIGDADGWDVRTAECFARLQDEEKATTDALWDTVVRSLAANEWAAWVEEQKDERADAECEDTLKRTERAVADSLRELCTLPNKSRPQRIWDEASQALTAYDNARAEDTPED